MENNSFINKHAISTAHNKTYLFLPFTFRRHSSRTEKNKTTF